MNVSFNQLHSLPLLGDHSVNQLNIHMQDYSIITKSNFQVTNQHASSHTYTFISLTYACSPIISLILPNFIHEINMHTSTPFFFLVHVCSPHINQDIISQTTFNIYRHFLLIPNVFFPRFHQHKVKSHLNQAT